MKKVVLPVLLGLMLLGSSGMRPAEAHELLPQNLLEFIEDNPDATPEEVEAFLNADPTLSRTKDHYKARLIETVFAGKVSFWHNVVSFTKLGIEHILGGTDHILFVLALVLTFVSLRTTLKSVTAFTVAHSVTLILAGSNILTLSSRIVEPIIAFSIAFVAIGTVFFRRIAFFRSMKTRASMIFVFGLFHGLGFAGLLKELTIPEGRFLSSLLFFNVGIEIGQLLIIALIVPLIYLFRNKSWYPKAIQIIAIAISGVALYWTAERLMG